MTNGAVRAATELADDYDVIVAGSGAAGLTAALAAAVSGARVLVVEAASMFGGTSAVSGGQVWIPGHQHGGLATADTVALVRDYCIRHTVGRSPAMIDSFLASGPAMLRFVEANTPLRFAVLPAPDSLTPPGEDQGWNVEPEPLAVAELGDWREWVFSPPYPAVLTNDEVASARLIFGGDLPREVIGERMARGEVTLGVALVVGLLRGCLAAGVDLVRRSRVTSIERDADGVLGVQLHHAEGGSERTLAGRVVLATGGFEHDEQLSASLLAVPGVVPASPPVGHGDGVRLAATVGAKLAHLSEAWYWPVVPSAETWGATASPRADIMLAERVLPHVIWVNSAGRRFVNEASHNCALALTTVDSATGRPGNLPAFAVGDAQYRARYPLAGTGQGDDWPAGATVADSLPALARRIGVDGDELVRTVEAFNRDAKAGRDTRFCRGETAYDRNLGDPETAHPNLGTITEPPFFALPVTLGAVGTKGGAAIDTHARVLDWADRPIPGLFAAGNAVAAPLGPALLSSGMTLGLAMTYGWLGGIAATTRGDQP